MYYISETYFRFETTTNLRLDVPQLQPVPALSVCWRYADILDMARLRNVTPEVRPVVMTTVEAERDTSRRIQSLITIGQLFAYTPQQHELFAGCVVRLPGNYDVEWLNETDCRQVFNVVRFYVQENICYRLQLATISGNLSYEYSYTSSALAFPSMAYEFGFNISRFDAGPIVFPTIHTMDTMPTSSIYFSPQIRRFYVHNSIVSTKISYATLTYSYIDNTRLPPPYDTNCDRYDNYGNQQDYCLSQCLQNATMAAFGLLPFTEIIEESAVSAANYDTKIINNLNWRNATFSAMLKSFEYDCGTRCYKPNCHERLFMTQLSTTSIYETSISFRVNLPQTPNYVIVYQPLMLFYEYATYVLSCFGIWFGISLYHLNPVALPAPKSAHDVHDGGRRAPSREELHMNQKLNDFDRHWSAVSSTSKAESVKLQVELNMLKNRVNTIERELHFMKMLQR